MVLAVVMLLVLVVMTDFSSQSSKTFTIAAVKQAIDSEQYYASIDSGVMCNTSLKIEGSRVLVNSNCVNESMLVIAADKVESKYCQMTPNHDLKIDCGEGYELVLS